MTRARDLAAFVSNADGDIKFDTDTLFIDSSANRVGIGTTTPDSAVDVEATHSQLRLTDSDDSKFVLFSYSGGNLVTRNNSTNTTTNQFTLTEGGNFGIGTTAPDTKLHVEGNLLVDAYNNAGVDGGIFLREGFLTTAQPSVTLWDMSNSGASPDGLSLNANDGIRFMQGGSERARITNDGLQFNGDTAAANALDDYEEGTWTPTFSHASNTYSLSNQVGFYVKVGKLVFISARLDVGTRTGSSSGSVKIEGLPFNTAVNHQGGMTPFQGNTGPNRIMMYAGPDRNYLQPYKNAFSAGYSTLQGTELNSGDSLIFNLTYFSA